MSYLDRAAVRAWFRLAHGVSADVTHTLGDQPRYTVTLRMPTPGGGHATGIVYSASPLTALRGADAVARHCRGRGLGEVTAERLAAARAAAPGARIDFSREPGR